MICRSTVYILLYLVCNLLAEIMSICSTFAECLTPLLILVHVLIKCQTFIYTCLNCKPTDIKLDEYFKIYQNQNNSNHLKHLYAKA